MVPRVSPTASCSSAIGSGRSYFTFPETDTTEVPVPSALTPASSMPSEARSLVTWGGRTASMPSTASMACSMSLPESTSTWKRVRWRMRVPTGPGTQGRA